MLQLRHLGQHGFRGAGFRERGVYDSVHGEGPQRCPACGNSSCHACPAALCVPGMGLLAPKDCGWSHMHAACLSTPSLPTLLLLTYSCLGPLPPCDPGR